jgi:aspartyl-tRNA(Asn)/glutamyl-tRNA(Gln) amidotransferase subunit C
VKITEHEVRYVASLANLQLSDEEVRRLNHDLDEVLTHIDALNELDTSNVEPMAQVLYEGGTGFSLSYDTATLRDDVPGLPLGTAAALENAAVAGAGYFKVPKVIER